MNQQRRRPNTTCGFTRKVARKQHRCNDCRREIERGVLYVQDDYYAPFGNGLRFCLACARDREDEESQWMLDSKTGSNQP